jgi:phosphoenolpyruvate synthase/pyruvate phosphate dikinase
MILPIDGTELDEGTVGGKAAGLSRLIALALPVPPAVVVPVAARGEVDEAGAIVRALGEPLAVRSSAVGEDAGDRSAAGQYESLMGVHLDDLAEAVRRVHASASSERVSAYGGAAEAMAVVIQREVDSARAGVAFSRDPVAASEAVHVECVFGHGERLVSGLATPDRYWVQADESIRARVARREGAHATVRTLRDDEVRAVADLTRRAEVGFERPVDVEFCFDRGGELWLVQCRPITALTPA